MIRPTVYLLSLVDENSFHAHNEIISSIIASTITATPSHKWNFRVHKTVRGRRLMEYGKVSFFMDRFFLKSNFKCLGITTWYLSNLFICAGEVFFFNFTLHSTWIYFLLIIYRQIFQTGQWPKSSLIFLFGNRGYFQLK